jgi:hypothetical protein
MKVSEHEKRLIITALNERAAQISDLLVHKNAGKSEWKKVDELYDLSTYIEFTLIEEDYVR